MPNALLSGPCTMGRSLPQGHCHFFVGMWRLRQAAETLMGGKQGGDARISAICDKMEDLSVCSICNRNGKEGFTRNARTV